MGLRPRTPLPPPESIREGDGLAVVSAADLADLLERVEALRGLDADAEDVAHVHGEVLAAAEAVAGGITDAATLYLVDRAALAALVARLDEAETYGRLLERVGRWEVVGPRD